MTEQEYYNKLTDTLSKFSPEFKDKFRTSALAHQTVEYLLRGGDVFRLIEQLIEAADNSTNALSRMIGTHPRPFIGTQKK